MYNNLLENYEYKAGIYIRLSQEDRDKKYESESESVINQRDILMSYIKNNGFVFVEEYVDDGYSGTNFDRPAFKKMIKDIHDKKINLVIVKDLSRLGRDHVNTGYFMEKIFPENRVRFISIMEGYDSAKVQASNDSSTFIVACNDYYSKQNSNKIRDVLRSKKVQGKYIGSVPCYGYMRDPEDKGHLIPDPNTALIVKDIFSWFISGMSISDIASVLNSRGVLTPSAYKKINLSSDDRRLNEWCSTSIRKILTNRMYTGDMVQNTQTKVNYKSKKRINLDKSLWIIVENTHEPLVDRQVFETIQKNRLVIPKTKTYREKRLFENLLFCKECGNYLSISHKKKYDYWTINCNKYARDPKKHRCESHFMPYDELEKSLLKRIKITISKYIKNISIEDINEKLIKQGELLEKNKNSDLIRLNKEKEKHMKKLDILICEMSDKIDKDTLDGLIRAEDKALLDIVKKIKELENKKDNSKEQIEKLPDYTKTIKEFLNINNPSRDLLFALIDRIEIDKDRNIQITYKFNLIDEDKYKYNK